ncbi:hypothetical protein CYLTODRAFT_427746, partial [Cylindrobasidium torrendii FP15055 ss-10]
MEFFNAHVPGYSAARARGPAATTDFITNLLNEYCAKFTWWLDPPQEPTPADLLASESTLSPTLLAQKAAKLDRLVTGSKNLLERLSTSAAPITKMTAAQIQRDPVASLIAGIANSKLELTRARTPYQLWSKSAFRTGVKSAVEVDVKSKVNGASSQKDAIPKTHRIASVQHNTMEAFEQLPAAEREMWTLQAEAEREAIKERKKNGSVVPPMLEPQKIQDAIDTMVNKIHPLIEGLSALTGGNVHFYWAGPEPAKGGQINVISMHAGVDSSAFPVDFGTVGGEQADGRRRLVEAAFGEWALRCHPTAARAARTLPGVPPSNTPPAFLRYRPMSWTTELQAAHTSTTPSVSEPAPRKDTKRKASVSRTAGPRKRHQGRRASQSDEEEDFEGDGLSDDDSGPDQPADAVRQLGTRKSRRHALPEQSLTQTNEGDASKDADQPPVTNKGNASKDVDQPPVTTKGNASDSRQPTPVDDDSEMASIAVDEANADVPAPVNEATKTRKSKSQKKRHSSMDVDEPPVAPVKDKASSQPIDSGRLSPVADQAKTRKSKTRATTKTATTSNAQGSRTTRVQGTKVEDTHPSYLKEALAKFNTLEDTDWANVVKTFVAYETKRGFQTLGRL